MSDFSVKIGRCRNYNQNSPILSLFSYSLNAINSCHGSCDVDSVM